MSRDKAAEFSRLMAEVQACRLCSRMKDSARVLNYSAGSLSADIMFVGEAPGRLGADETEVPFHGDKSGRNFEDLLAFSGLNRSIAYVTNSVLCNPRDANGNNSTPLPVEVQNCSGFMRRQIQLIQPKLVVTLGAVALKALESIEPHGLTLNTHVRTLHNWFGRGLIPLYHPGQRAMLHRSFANQRSDYQFVAESLRRISTPRTVKRSPAMAEAVNLAKYIIQSRGHVTYFELHKLAYLAEYVHVKNHGRRLTSSYFIRQKDGPYCTDLQIDRLRGADDGIQVSKQGGQLLLFISRKAAPSLFGPGEKQAELTDEAKKTLDETLARYQYRDGAELKTAVYLTAPMRHILRREQMMATNLYNAPIDFLAAS